MMTTFPAIAVSENRLPSSSLASRGEAGLPTSPALASVASDTPRMIRRERNIIDEVGEQGRANITIN
jgi:hypothetical protein